MFKYCKTIRSEYPYCATQCTVGIRVKGVPIIGSAISYRLYGLVFAYRYRISNMCNRLGVKYMSICI